jgi:hypothetical protein
MNARSITNQVALVILAPGFAATVFGYEQEQKEIELGKLNHGGMCTYTRKEIQIFVWF